MAQYMGSPVQRGLLSVAAACFLGGAGVTVTDVIARSVAMANVPGAIEISSFLIGFGALVSMPVCYAQRSNVTAKLLSEMRPHWFARPLGKVGAVASTIFAGLMLYMIAENTLSKLGSPETSRDLELPMPVLLGIVTITMALAFIAAVIGLLLELNGKRG